MSQRRDGLSLITTLASYRRLTLSQRSVLYNKVIDGHYPPAYWVKFLTGLADYDTKTDALGQSSRKLCLFSLLPLAVSFLYPPLWFLSLPLTAGAGATYWFARRTGLGPRLRSFILPLVILLGEDVKTGQPLHLRTDLRGGTSRRKATGNTASYKRGRYHRIRETGFQDPWLSGEALLADGARLEWQCLDTIRRLAMSKKNRRGKIKTKIKYKRRSSLAIRLDLPTGSYRLQSQPQLPADGTRLQILTGEKWHRLRARQISRLSGERLPDPELKPVLDLLARLYALAEPIPQGRTTHA